MRTEFNRSESMGITPNSDLRLSASEFRPADAQPACDVPGVVEHLFRHEAGKIIAVLIRVFGIEHLGLAEDVVQDTLARALQTWPYHGIPDNPAAWIMRAARNRALDVVRRDQNFRSKEAEIIQVLDQPSAAPSEAIEYTLADDCLRLMFVCCHPRIPADAQAALALKTLCGFGITEISRAFLTTDAAIAKRLTRAKADIREAGIRFEIPEGAELATRLDGVLQTLYLLFNEGYKASQGDRLVREELCHESIRLTKLLVDHPAGNQTKTHALLSVMLLNAARFPARVDDAGNLLRLKEQDRTLWESSLLAQGMFHLRQSAAGSELSVYHLQAGIAACHSTAATYEQTDWRRILGLYDQLLERDLSPVVALNRAIVVAHLEGPRAGLEAVAAISQRDKLEGYHLYFATLGELETRRRDFETAAQWFRRAAELAEVKSEKAFLERRYQSCVAELRPESSASVGA